MKRWLTASFGDTVKNNEVTKSLLHPMELTVFMGMCWEEAGDNKNM